MSAYLVRPEHTAVVALHAYARLPGIANLPTGIAHSLAAQNVASILARYGADDITPDEAEDYICDCMAAVDKPEVVRAAILLLPRRILGLVNCLDYQSNETADYEATEAWRILDSLRNRLCQDTNDIGNGWELQEDELYF